MHTFAFETNNAAGTACSFQAVMDLFDYDLFSPLQPFRIHCLVCVLCHGDRDKGSSLWQQLGPALRGVEREKTQDGGGRLWVVDAFKNEVWKKIMCTCTRFTNEHMLFRDLGACTAVVVTPQREVNSIARRLANCG